MVVHPGDHPQRGGDADERRRAPVEPAQHLPVGGIDPLGGHAVQPRQGGDQLRTAPGGDAPVDLDGRGPLGPDRVAEERQADVDDPHLGRERSRRRAAAGVSGH
jgi:hypothetical protein